MQAYTTYKLGGPVSELLYSPAAYGIDFAARDAPRPRARANPMLAVAGNMLWLLGGVVEVRRALSWCAVQGWGRARAPKCMLATAATTIWLLGGIVEDRALHWWPLDVAELLIVIQALTTDQREVHGLQCKDACRLCGRWRIRM